MTKFTYKNLNAHDILDRVIARERDFAKISYHSLSFFEKCNYLLNYNILIHPSIKDKRFRARAYAELKPELMRYAAQGDHRGMYFMAMLSGPNDLDPAIAREYIKCASERYAPAITERIFLKLRCGKDIDREACELVNSLNEFIYDESEDEMHRLRALNASRKVLKTRLGDEAAYAIRYIDDERFNLAARGNFFAIQGMAYRARVKLEAEPYAEVSDEARAEYDFWQTALTLVYDHYATLGVSGHYVELSRRLATGMGCEVDEERSISLLVDGILVYQGGVGHIALTELEAQCDRLEKVKPCIPRIVHAFLAEDREALTAAVTEAYKSGHRCSAIRAHSMIAVAEHRGRVI